MCHLLNSLDGLQRLSEVALLLMFVIVLLPIFGVVVLTVAGFPDEEVVLAAAVEA